MNSVYLCIDLKTFYASVECVCSAGWTRLRLRWWSQTHRGAKGAICLAVSPKMKALGVAQSLPYL